MPPSLRQGEPGYKGDCYLYAISIKTATAHRVGEVSKLAVPVTMLQSEDLEGVWDDHALPLVIGWGNALECLQPLQGRCSSLGLVRNHSAQQHWAFMPDGLRSLMLATHRNLDGKLRVDLPCAHSTAASESSCMPSGMKICICRSVHIIM